MAEIKYFPFSLFLKTLSRYPSSHSSQLKTFFAPWHKYNWKYPKFFDIKEFFNTLISNAFSRILGATVRIVLIIIGILFQIFVVVAGSVIFIGWLLAPIVAIAGILFVLLI